MQELFDELYDKSIKGYTFESLMDIILSDKNIMLAYRSIKNNTGSSTAGTDNLTIGDISKMTAEEVIEKVRFILTGTVHGYRPKPVRRKEIPKPNGTTRPLGIPCIWDRLIQQCIKQVMEPICEAKFSNNSYGFRPCRSVENAIQKLYRYMQISNLHYIVEFDIKGFFDNVNHSKLIKQIWTLGIHDKHLIYIIKKILKAPIRMPDNSTIIPEKGTPQGGILSPLLANIVLNELDHWIDSQWQENILINNYHARYNKNGARSTNAYRAMRNTNLKEVYIIRYADDFRILCHDKETAEKIKIATTNWLKERLKLDISEEKTRIVNVKERYSEFLGFKIKVRPKAGKYTVCSHMSDKAKARIKQKLIKQAKHICKPKDSKDEAAQIWLYNEMVIGIQNYYRIATDINLDCSEIHRAVMTVLTGRMKRHGRNSNRLSKCGRELSTFEKDRFKNTSMMRYATGSKEPIYPIAYIQHKKPMCKTTKANLYTTEGRVLIHDSLGINMNIMKSLMQVPLYNQSIQYHDNRISLYSGQNGKCAVTGEFFNNASEIACHHIIPKKYGGTDEYHNLMLVKKEIHLLIHATDEDTIKKYMSTIKPNKDQMEKINKLRNLAKNKSIG